MPNNSVDSFKEREYFSLYQNVKFRKKRYAPNVIFPTSFILHYMPYVSFVHESCQKYMNISGYLSQGEKILGNRL